EHALGAGVDHLGGAGEVLGPVRDQAPAHDPDAAFQVFFLGLALDHSHDVFGGGDVVVRPRCLAAGPVHRVELGRQQRRVLGGGVPTTQIRSPPKSSSSHVGTTCAGTP